MEERLPIHVLPYVLPYMLPYVSPCVPPYVPPCVPSQVGLQEQKGSQLRGTAQTLELALGQARCNRI